MAQSHASQLQATATSSSLPAMYLQSWKSEQQTNPHPPLYMKEDAMLFVINGQVQCRYGNQYQLLNTNGFVFLKKGSLLEYQQVSEQGEWLLIVIRQEQVLQFAGMSTKVADSQSSPEQVIWGEADQPLVEFCQAVSGRLRHQGEIPEPLVTIKMLEFMFQLSGSNPAIINQLMDCKERCIRDIPAIIEEKLMDDVPMPQLARLAGRSLSSFRRDFFTIYNMAPSKWIRQKKLEKARQLLANTNMTITEICYTMGFQSNAHFSRVFKSNFGYPPSDMRRLSA